jgi:hypothetical protein
MAERMAEPVDASRLLAAAARRVVRKLAEPADLPHRKAASAAPLDRLADRQALVLGHHLQRLPGAPFCVADRCVAFTECGQHGDRQTLEPALPVGPLFAQYRLGIQRRAPRRLPHHLLTHHRLPIHFAPSLSPKHLPARRAVITTISTCFTYPQPISRSDVPHTSFIPGLTADEVTAGEGWPSFWLA